MLLFKFLPPATVSVSAAYETATGTMHERGKISGNRASVNDGDVVISWDLYHSARHFFYPRLVLRFTI